MPHQVKKTTDSPTVTYRIPVFSTQLEEWINCRHIQNNLWANSKRKIVSIQGKSTALAQALQVPQGRPYREDEDGDGEKNWRASTATEIRKWILPRLDLFLEKTTHLSHTTIEQNILDIRKVETSIETSENKLKKNFKKNNALIWESFNWA